MTIQTTLSEQLIFGSAGSIRADRNTIKTLNSLLEEKISGLSSEEIKLFDRIKGYLLKKAQDNQFFARYLEERSYFDIRKDEGFVRRMIRQFKVDEENVKNIVYLALALEEVMTSGVYNYLVDNDPETGYRTYQKLFPTLEKIQDELGIRFDTPPELKGLYVLIMRRDV